MRCGSVSLAALYTAPLTRPAKSPSTRTYHVPSTSDTDLICVSWYWLKVWSVSNLPAAGGRGDGE
jgi:hypothetical protein